jgi:hypothetical protein
VKFFDRKAAAEEKYYGRKASEAEIEATFKQFNTLPPTRTLFCADCSEAVYWRRESASFNAKNGKAGHTYHYCCPNFGRAEWQDPKTGETWRDSPPFQATGGQWPNVPIDDERASDLKMDILGRRHYNSHEYRWVEGSAERYENDRLW